MSTDDYAFNIKLVQAVEKRPCLYDCTMKGHRNRDLIQAAWETVAEDVNSNANECKKIWTRLRVNYSRFLKNPPSVYRATGQTSLFLSHMSFLRKFMKSKKNIRKNRPLPPRSKKRSAPSKPTVSKDKNQNVEDYKAHSSNAANSTVKSLSSMDSTTPQDSLTEPPQKKKNPQNNSAKSSESKTEDRDSFKQQFLLSLLPDLEEMDANQFRIFRIKALNLIDSVLASQQTISKPVDEVSSLAEPLVSPQQKPQIFGEVSSMTRTLVPPQPISQSSNEMSSMLKPTTSSSITLQHQSDSPIDIGDDTDDEDILTRAANCKVELSL